MVKAQYEKALTFIYSEIETRDGVTMAQEAISASSKYWDDKQIALTENTKKNIMKKAYTLDAETMFAQYQLAGEDAVNAMSQNGITEEQLITNPGTYTYAGASAIHDLEANASKDSRTMAIQNLTKLGYTNLFDANTKNFITPPEEPVEEKPVEQPVVEEPQQNYRYQRRPQPQQIESQAPQPEPEPEPSYGVHPSPRATLSGAARFIPNAVRNNLPQRNPNRMTPANMAPARMAPNPGAYVRPGRDWAATHQRQPVQKQQFQRNAPPQSRPLLNAGMAAKLGSSGIKKPNIGASPRPRFGLGVRR